MIEEHDIVIRLSDKSEGTVVHIYPNAAAYVVEFDGGKVETLKPDEIKKKHL